MPCPNNFFDFRSVLSFLLASTCLVWGQPGTITTIAGGYTGDGGPAVLAGLNGPTGIALASDGTMYIADSNSHRIRKVSPDGMISTFAGNGTNGYSGDGGPAAEAQLNFPQGLALGPDGSLYLADTSNHVIRRVSQDGTISTFAGTGKDEFGGDGGPATSARLRNPEGLAVDSRGQLYIVDSVDYRIRFVDERGNISTLAGTGAYGSNGDGGPATSAQLARPHSVALVGDGSYYIGQAGICRIRFVGRDGRISTFADPCLFGGGAIGLAIGRRGLYVSIRARIMLVSADGKVSVFAGAGGITNNQVEGELANGLVMWGSDSLIVTPDETLYYSDNGNHQVRRIIDGRIYTVAGTGGALDDQGRASGDGGNAASAKLNAPMALQFGSDGALYVADSSNARVRRVAVDGTISTATGTGVFGYNAGDGGPATEARVNLPLGLAIGDGVLYIADFFNSRVRAVGPDGIIRTFAGSGSAGFGGDGGPAGDAKISPRGLARSKEGTVYIVDGNNNRIRAVGANGNISTFAGNGVFGVGDDGVPATSAPFGGVSAVVVAEDGAVFIAEGARVRRVGLDGLISTVAGSATPGATGAGDGGPAINSRLGFPSSLAFGPDGSLYISEASSNRIRKVDTNGIISTVAGSGALGFGGDDGPATEAKLNYPQGVAIGPDGALYISDTGNNRIRRVELAAPGASAVPSRKGGSK